MNNKTSLLESILNELDTTFEELQHVWQDHPETMEKSAIIAQTNMILALLRILDHADLDPGTQKPDSLNTLLGLVPLSDNMTMLTSRLERLLKTYEESTSWSRAYTEIRDRLEQLKSSHVKKPEAPIA